jgi:PPOX class probable F420-dependent enzyme
VAAAPVARLATIDPDGRPNLVPFCFALTGDILYTAVDHKPKEGRLLQRTANVLRDPRATVLVDHYQDDWERLWWVRIRGRGRLVEDQAERQRAAGALVERYEPYRNEPPEEGFLAIEIDEWRGWSYSPIE